MQEGSWILVKAKRPGDKPYTVLSVDGGGLRGAIPVALLEALENHIKEYISDDVCSGKDTLDLDVYTVSAHYTDVAGVQLETTGPLEEDWFRCATRHVWSIKAASLAG